MSRFLVKFFFVYAMMHLYFAYRASVALRLSAPWVLCLFLFLSAMAAAPVYARRCVGRRLWPWSRFVYWTTYTWMGFLFMFTWVGLVFEVVSHTPMTANALGAPLALPMLPDAGLSFAVVMGISLFLAVYSMLEASSIRVRKVRIVTDRLPADVKPFRIAQISDVHLGIIVRKRRTRAIAEAVRREAPDVLVSTGDLIDAPMEHVMSEAEILSSVSPPLGKYAIRGNHEFYHGGGRVFDEFAAQAGFVQLRGKSVSLGGCVRLSGVDDEVGRMWGVRTPGEGHLLSGSRSREFSVLLKHRPEVSRKAMDKFDLQLSGHTHGGQMFPFFLVTQTRFPYVSGLYRPDAAKRLLLYVSNGSGTWGPPMRLFTPPEVTIFEIVGQGGKVSPLKAAG